MLDKLHSKLPELMLTLTGILGGLYLYQDTKSSQKEIQSLDQKLQKYQDQDGKKVQQIFNDNNVRLQDVNNENQKQVICICFTGGPGNSRTSVISFLQESLKDFQYNVIVLPFLDDLMQIQEQEIFNKLPAKQKHYLLIKQIICRQQLLDYQKELARNVKDKNSVILCQGGLLDLLPLNDLDEQFYETLEEQFQPLAQIRDRNYDAVIHLVTNADGLLQEYYVGGSQAQREEKIQKAIETDKKLQKLWTGHPNHFLIDNRGNKIQRAYKIVLKIIGVQSANLRWAKFEVKKIQIPRELFETSILLTDIFFSKEEKDDYCETNRVRIRQIEGGVKQYYLITTIKKGSDIQFRRQFISYEVSQYLLNLQKSKLRILKRKRLCLAYENQMMQLDLFDSKKIAILRVAESDAVEIIRIPNWLSLGRRVDEVSKYDSFNLAEEAQDQQFQP